MIILQNKTPSIDRGMSTYLSRLVIEFVFNTPVFQHRPMIKQGFLAGRATDGIIRPRSGDFSILQSKRKLIPRFFQSII